MFPANMASKSSTNRQTQFKAYKNKRYIYQGNGLPEVSTKSHVHGAQDWKYNNLFLQVWL